MIAARQAAQLINAEDAPGLERFAELLSDQTLAALVTILGDELAARVPLR
jgi:hypothetical protein